MESQKKQQISYMTVDDVIQRLQHLKEERGNLPIKILLPGLSRKPIISGIRIANSGSDSQPSIDIVPKFDVKGSINQLAGTNSIIYNIATLQTLFVSFARSMVQVKTLLEEFAKNKVKGNYNGRRVEIVPHLKTEFTKLYEIAKDIQSKMKTLKDFNTNLKHVIKEPIREADYAATFAHHIDFDLSDSEFARLITSGLGEKTSVQRLATYVDIIGKINAEIANRKHRIQALESRMKADPSSNEALNASQLKKKSESIIDTMMKRRDYILSRYATLKKSVQENLATLDSDVNNMLEEHREFRMNKRGKGALHA